MSKRALEAAWKVYPPETDFVEMNSLRFVKTDRRAAYIQGYEQAEKDIALNIDDLKLLHTLLYAVKNNKQGCFTFTRLSNEQYEEVLRRFNEQRNRQ